MAPDVKGAGRMRGIGGRALDFEDKRALLLDSAERTFCRLGYARTSISAIAADAGVTRPTVYAYFPSKDDVFRALADRVREEFLALQERADTSSPAATARSTMNAYFDACVRHRGMLTVIAHQALSDPDMARVHDEIHGRVNRRHTRFLQRLLDAGEIAPPVPPAAASEAITGITLRFAEQAGADPAQAEALRAQLLALYLSVTGLRDRERGEHQY